jgi:hypothetical protein
MLAADPVVQGVLTMKARTTVYFGIRIRTRRGKAFITSSPGGYRPVFPYYFGLPDSDIAIEVCGIEVEDGEDPIDVVVDQLEEWGENWVHITAPCSTREMAEQVVHASPFRGLSP